MTLTVGQLIAYYSILLIVWIITCELVPFKLHIKASVVALFFCALPFVLLALL